MPMEPLPQTLNTRDALQLEQLIIEADNMVLKQMMLLLQFQLGKVDTPEAETTLARLKQDAVRLRAQRRNLDASFGWRVRAAE
jgi:hypothetical protein